MAVSFGGRMAVSFGGRLAVSFGGRWRQAPQVTARSRDGGRSEDGNMLWRRLEALDLMVSKLWGQQ